MKQDWDKLLLDEIANARSTFLEVQTLLGNRTVALELAPKVHSDVLRGLQMFEDFHCRIIADLPHSDPRLVSADGIRDMWIDLLTMAENQIRSARGLRAVKRSSFL